MLNRKPDIDVAYSMVATFMDIVGQDFLSVYKAQAQKCLHLASTEWAAGGSGPRWSRFLIVCEDWQKGKIGVNAQYLA
jgi:hypothetical protein